MNWTGGQLRRHSARQGILSKTQKQSFAKSRQQASSRVPHQPTTLRRVPDPDNGGDDRLEGDTTCRNEQMMGEEAQNHTASPSLPPLARSIPADSTGLLGTLKRRLLQDPDWAAVSAARPLEIAFTSAQEAEHFGKRRRLTETDRKRLSATHGNQTTLTFPMSHYWKDRDNPLDQIQIKITGQPHSQHPRNSQGVHTPPDRYANQTFARSQSPDLPRPRLSANAQYSAHPRSDLSASEAPPSTESPIQHTRHFTIEEKVLEVKPDHGPQFPSSHQQLQRELSCSPTETLPASPTLIVTDSLSTTGTQSWLPQPTRRAFPSSPLLSRSKAVDLPTRASHVPSHNQNSSVPFTRCAEDTSPATPVKIFGQLVRMCSTDRAECL